MVMSNVTLRSDFSVYSVSSRSRMMEVRGGQRAGSEQQEDRRRPAPTPEAEIEAMEEPERWDGLA